MKYPGFHIAVLFYLVLIHVQNSFVRCDFTFTYEPDDFPMAIMNWSYIDPLTAVLKKEKTDIGRFGQGILKDVSGVIVHVTSNNHTSHKACDRLDADRLPQERFIALIKQGQCKDEIKLIYAAEANASAVIMYGEYISSNFVRISYRVLQLPYVFIHPDKGNQLASLVDNGTRVFASIGIDKRHSFRYASINRSSVLFVSISFIFLMILSMAWLVFYYVQKFRFVVSKDVRTKRLSSATLEALEKIPVKTMRDKDFADSDDVEYCAVCIEILKTEDVVRILPCKHRFHKVCVDPWLLEQRSCPMCKLDILMYFGITWYGSQESLWEFDDGSLHRRRSSVMQEVIHIVSSRRNSSSQTNPPMEDRGTSPFEFMPLNTHEDFVELSLDYPLPQHDEEEEEDLESSLPSEVSPPEEINMASERNLNSAIDVDTPDACSPKDVAE